MAFPPTTAPPRAGVGPHAPRGRPWTRRAPQAPPPAAPAADQRWMQQASCRSAPPGREPGDGEAARLGLRCRGGTDANAMRAEGSGGEVCVVRDGVLSNSAGMESQILRRERPADQDVRD
jgi:hypothetical protein